MFRCYESFKGAARSVAAKLTVGAGVIAGALVVGSPAMADTAVDVSAIVTTIGDALTAGAAIGVAILGMHYGIKLYKWVKAAG